MRRNLSVSVVGSACRNEAYSCGKHKFHDGKNRKGSDKPHIDVLRRRDKKRVRRFLDRVYKDLMEV